jgi:hypothetical protein
MRLELTLPFVSSWPQALSVQAQPGNVLEALRLRAVLVDELCHGAGLASADMSWYGDRAMLGAVYSSAELFLLTDGSPELADTWQFLARSVKVRVPSRPRSSRGTRRQREGARMWSLCVRRGSNRTRLRRELYWAALTGQWLECVYTKLSSRPLGATVHCQTKEAGPGSRPGSRQSAKLALGNAAPLTRSLALCRRRWRRAHTRRTRERT